MMMWKIEFSRQVLKDAKKIKSANLDGNLKELLQILKSNPYQSPYEKLSGNLKGYYSRRIKVAVSTQPSAISQLFKVCNGGFKPSNF
jgi:Txe/YoeB family toxin of Txe-Axe toxin-antitoxin module